MSEEKKYVTFRDLRTTPKPAPVVESPSPPAPTPVAEAVTTSPPSSSTSTSSITSISSSTSRPRTSSYTSRARAVDTESSKQAQSAAPERDFQRVPNSVTRQALPEGQFRGKSKQVWDYLWSVSRGAIVPTRSVRKSRREIKSGAGLGSMVTVDAAIEHLKAVGLIKINAAVGSLVGNEYEVFTPEEVADTYTSTSSTSRYTSLTQKVVHLDVPESGISSTTQVVENTDLYVPPKTSFKTKRENFDDDDEIAAFADLIARFQNAAKELTGRELNAADKAKLGELGELLIAELQIAAARTQSISNLPAFLTEHLRRRLWKREKAELMADDAATAGEGKARASSTTTAAAAVRLTREQIKGCPDCGGAGFFYPNGFDAGVVKCRHENLIVEGKAESVETEPN